LVPFARDRGGFWRRRGRRGACFGSGGGGGSATSFSLGIGLHVYFAGPFFAEFDFAGDAVGGGSFMKTYSLAIGIANL
jgi:hypothetical protein